MVIVSGEKIEAVVGHGESFSGEVVDVGELVVMAGLVDTHVHINEPGRTEWEGFETATKAAAAGGVTTVVDMPLNSSPVTTTAAAAEVEAGGFCWEMFCGCGVSRGTDSWECGADGGVVRCGGAGDEGVFDLFGD